MQLIVHSLAFWARHLTLSTHAQLCGLLIEVYLHSALLWALMFARANDCAVWALSMHLWCKWAADCCWLNASYLQLCLFHLYLPPSLSLMVCVCAINSSRIRNRGMLHVARYVLHVFVQHFGNLRQAWNMEICSHCYSYFWIPCICRARMHIP